MILVALSNIPAADIIPNSADLPLPLAAFKNIYFSGKSYYY